MSADNWRTCPQCLAQSTAAANAAFRKAADAYGKVSAADWEALRDAARELDKAEQKDTLREDYELGTTPSGEFYVSYSCACTECGFSHKFSHREQLKRK